MTVMKKYQFDKAAFRWVRDVVLDKAPSLNYCCYSINEGTVSASNGRITCCSPCTDLNSYMVHGKEIDRLVSVIEDDGPLDVSFAETRLTLSRKGFKALLPRLPYEDWQMVKPVGEWKDLPDGFVVALQTLRPFISDNAAQAWATAILIAPTFMLATNNVSIIRYDIETPVLEAVMLPIWAVDFILARPNVQQFEGNSKRMAFKWPTGAWMGTCLIDGNFPETAVSLAKQTTGEGAEPIEKEWRAAFKTIAPLAESTIELSAEMIVARREVASLEAEMPNKMPENTPVTLWPAKTLQNIIDISEAWGPHLWPAPAPFKGKNFVGLIVGRRA